MIRKIYLQSVLFFSIFFMIITGSIVYARGPKDRSVGDFFLWNDNYAMMGGHGMMGGGSMGNFGQDVWDGYDPRSNQKEYEYKASSPNSKEEIELLRKEIDEKRNELASIFRSSNPDKALIDKKIKELGILERFLDEKISSYEAGR